MKLFAIALSLNLIAQLIFPEWWVIAPVSFLVGLMYKKGKNALGGGFLAVAVLWLCFAAYIHIASEGRLTNRMAVMFNLPSPLLIFSITVLIGGLVAGLASWSGFLLKWALRK